MKLKLVKNSKITRKHVIYIYKVNPGIQPAILIFRPRSEKRCRETSRSPHERCFSFSDFFLLFHADKDISHVVCTSHIPTKFLKPLQTTQSENGWSYVLVIRSICFVLPGVVRKSCVLLWGVRKLVLAQITVSSTFYVSRYLVVFCWFCSWRMLLVLMSL